MAEATLIARIKAAGGKAAAAAFEQLVKALRLLRDSAKQAATPLRQLGRFGASAATALKKAAEGARAASKTLSRIAQSKAAATLSKVNQAAKRAAGGLGRMADVINQLNAKLRSMGKAADAAVGKLRAAGAATRRVGAAAQAAGAKVKGFGQSLLDGGGVLGKFRAGLLDAFLIKGLIDTFVQSISRAAKALAGLINEAQKTNIALTAAEIKLQASTDGAEQLIEANLRLAEVTKRFGVELTASKEALAEFLAATRQSNIGFQERLGLFESLIQVSRTFNLSSERIKLAFLAITQVASKGAAALEEIRRQLGDQIPGIVPLLAEKLGKTVPQLFEDLRAKAVSSEEAIRGLRDAFNDLSDEQAVIAGQTLAASIGRLGRELDLLKLSFGETTEEGVQRFIDEAGRLATSLEFLGKAFGGELNTGLLAFGGNLTSLLASIELIKGEKGLAFLPGIFNSAFQGAVPGAVALTDVVGLLAAALKPIADEKQQERLNALAGSFDKIAESAAAGTEQLTLAFSAQEDGVERASAAILKISQALRDGTLSRAEAERLLSSIILQETAKQRIALQKLRREHEERRAETERQIEAERRAAKAVKESATEQEAAERRIQDAIESTSDAAQSQAQLRLKIGADLAKRLVEFEVKVGDDIRALLNERAELLGLEGEKRAEIQEKAAKKAEEIQEKLFLKLAEIREEATEKAREEGAKLEEITEEQLEEELKARRKANAALGKLLEQTTEKFEAEAKRRAKIAEKQAEKEIEEAERALKAKLKLLDDELQARRSVQEQINDLLDEDQDGGTVSFGGDSSGATAAAGDLAAALAELATLRTGTFSSIGEAQAALNRQFELTSEIIPRLRGQIRSVGSDLGAAGQDLVGFGEKLLGVFRENTVGADGFRDELAKLGAGAVSQFQSIAREVEGLASAGNLNIDTLNQALGRTEGILLSAGSQFSVLDERSVKLGNAFTDLGEKSSQSGLPQLGQDADTAAVGAGRLGAEVTTITKGLRELLADQESARITISNLGEDSDEAAGDVRVLVDASEDGATSVSNLGDAASDAAVAEKELGDRAAEVSEKAKIPEEVIESIRNLGATAETVAPLLDPLVVPLAGVAAAVTDLSTAVPVLPEPLKSIAGEIIKLVGAKVLAPMAEGLKLIAEQSQPLSETLPIAAEAQEGFNKAAGESPEPLGKLAAALKAVAEEGLITRLGQLAESLNEVNSKLVNLAVEGFEKSERKAGEFRKALVGDEGLLAALQETARYLDNEFSEVLNRHAVSWGELVDDAGRYIALLERLRDQVFPSVGEAGVAMFAALRAEGGLFEQMLDRLAEKLASLAGQGDEVFEGDTGLPAETSAPVTGSDSSRPPPLAGPVGPVQPR